VIDAVLFDWAGTLTPYHDVDVMRAWTAAAEVLAPDRVEEVALALMSAERESWPERRTTLLSTTTEELLRSGSLAAGVSADAPALAHAAKAFRGEWSPHLAARSDARAVLTALRERALRTGLLSNTHWPREWHEDALALDGLGDLLDVRLYSSELTHMKPHRVVFEALLGAVGTTAERAVFVGDRLHDDISGAKAAGMRTVWVRNDRVPHHDVVPDATIEVLSELVEVIDRWIETR
jgi:putative hydrolase of the HAD superfamily